ncbi:rhodanese-like domain-containing protein [Cryobacterium sp. TMT1-21]|uniref:Rhodanese-like domain-containing protein n=2 Tax=Microbacteriaceae TaxID=85023 RepID=A0AAQ2C567_9MICO|nr:MULTISPECIES: rhodanese-like domain-containing protein [Cryobacterium]TFC44407.1 rhodanese-like domain-containing protein [Cryobacterium shii]TFC88499.1 rhodanese-like domain-containing protein [Cryobacterium sp. TmT2-59]TFD11952.1 rhodanese-like domain-containing protein [Cryobacterium sp. TMT1-21]TFD18938.1 rhodanese-like domain-containing protein [Cryobacterium sp. TMT2-23]TFD20970.1 rhodanese-like domain-containing protein [Cryobacterium sp. TMT4-10]
MEITPQQVFARLADTPLADAQIVDVRETAELADGMIDGAIHIPLSTVPERHGELDRARPVIVVCRSGRRSASAADQLSQVGFDAYTMAGGMLEWAALGFPTVVPLTH